MAGGCRTLAVCLLAAVAASSVGQAFLFASPAEPLPRTAPLARPFHGKGARALAVSAVAALAANSSSSVRHIAVSSVLVASLAIAAVARNPARSSRVVCQFKKRYGGGPAVKEDPAAMEEYGPQYVGPRLGFQIQRKARLGMPKAGKNRCIPKLSGGSYERRKNMMRNLTTNLIRHGRIKTTLARATALGPFVDRMIVLAKRGDDLSRREANEWMYDEDLVENLFNLARERYPDQVSDFTQVTRTMNRKGDWADMAYIELL